MTAFVVSTRRGHLGHIHLNRPEAINALTHDMVRQISAELRRWTDDPAVSTVLLTGEGDRGLCAGGDVVVLREDAAAGRVDSATTFWRDEYSLNASIAECPKPFVAFMDGLVLGGGVGLSAHAAFRVVTERTSIGLPETAIGFIPDVGSTWLLSRAPGGLGTHLALTASRADAADALHLGLADHFVPSWMLPRLASTLESVSAPEAIARYSEQAPLSVLMADAPWIDDSYSSDDVATVLRLLETSPHPSAQDAARRIRRNSPTAVAVTLASLRRARQARSLKDALDQEFVVSIHAFSSPDFAEGVRAQLVDKDRKPHWAAAPDEAQITAHFVPARDHRPLFDTE